MQRLICLTHNNNYERITQTVQIFGSFQDRLFPHCSLPAEQWPNTPQISPLNLQKVTLLFQAVLSHIVHSLILLFIFIVLYYFCTYFIFSHTFCTFTFFFSVDFVFAPGTKSNSQYCQLFLTVPGNKSFLLLILSKSLSVAGNKQRTGNFLIHYSEVSSLTQACFSVFREVAQIITVTCPEISQSLLQIYKMFNSLLKQHLTWTLLGGVCK